MKKFTVLDGPELPHSRHERPQKVTVQTTIKYLQLVETEVFLMHIVDFNLNEVVLVFTRCPDYSKPLALLLSNLI